MRIRQNKKYWSYKVAEGRWCGFGPYYAMFPVDFARRVINRFCPKKGRVLDPFCGRGTTPFVAQATGRESLGADLNPVAWVYSKVKTDPHPDIDALKLRIEEVYASIENGETIAENEFQELAWSPQVLGFLRSARRTLDWRNLRLDRTLMGFILVYLHAKLGNGISNQMRQSKALSPNYSVRWWRERQMEPPTINPVEYFKGRLDWRYKSGIVKGPIANIHLGDSIEVLSDQEQVFDLLLTSPPYCGVTDYKLDNWIRLWMLGGPALPEYKSPQKHSNHEKYKVMIQNVFEKSSRLLSDNSVIYVRTHSKPESKDITLDTIADLWPSHSIFTRSERPSKSQTKLYGDHSPKPGETDILAFKSASYRAPYGFNSVREIC